MTDEPLVWAGFDRGAGPPHPTEPMDPSNEPWQCATLYDAADTVFATVWVGKILDRVVADFRFEDALLGENDTAVLPLLVDGFFGDDGHTLGYYRHPDRFRSVHFTNLRTGASWSISWEWLDEIVAEMKTSPEFVPRAMR